MTTSPLPVADYETPILITLLESPSMGLSRQDALDRIKERVGRYMTDADFVTRPSPNDSQQIWVHHVDRMVQILVHDLDWVTHPYSGSFHCRAERSETESKHLFADRFFTTLRFVQNDRDEMMFGSGR